MGKKILVVVDYQYDFFSPDGALYVNGGEKLQEKIANIIPNFDNVIFTQDRHPFNHCSFVENGGQWPMHCVENTIGAGIPVELLKVVANNSKFKNCIKIIPKGINYDKEEYGAFSSDFVFRLNMENTYNNEVEVKEFWNVFHNHAEDYDYVDEIVVCGIAGDYCVLETLKNIVKHIGNDKVSVFLDGVVSIDDGTTLNTYMKENNIKTYKD